MINYDMHYSLQQNKVYTFVEPSTQNWGVPDGKSLWILKRVKTQFS